MRGKSLLISQFLMFYSLGLNYVRVMGVNLMKARDPL